MDIKTCLNIAAKNNAPLDISKMCDAAKLVQGWAGLGWAGLGWCVELEPILRIPLSR